MVPFEAFWMSSPHCSIAFCSGCDGGTQCDSFSSEGLSCADAVPKLSTSPSAARPQSFKWRVPSIGVSPCDLVANRTFPFNRRTARLYMICALPCQGRAIAYENRKANKTESSLEQIAEKRLRFPVRSCTCDSPALQGRVKI